MYIGELSKLTGATPRAIRLYESMGLIPTPDRKGKYRNYNADHVELLQIIKKAKELGFKLSEIKELTSSNATCEKFPWEKAENLVQSKIAEVQNEIIAANKLLSELNHFSKNLVNKKCSNEINLDSAPMGIL